MQVSCQEKTEFSRRALRRSAQKPTSSESTARNVCLSAVVPAVRRVADDLPAALRYAGLRDQIPRNPHHLKLTGNARIGRPPVASHYRQPSVSDEPLRAPLIHSGDIDSYGNLPQKRVAEHDRKLRKR